MRYVCLFIFLLGAVGYDIDYRRIPNFWNLFGILSGLTISCMESGVYGGIFSLFGIVLPLAVLFVFFIWRILGAGDIKMLSVIGSFVWLEVWRVALYAFALTALYGLIVSITRLIIRRPFTWTRICMSIPIAAGTILFIVGGRFV